MNLYTPLWWYSYLTAPLDIMLGPRHNGCMVRYLLPFKDILIVTLHSIAGIKMSELKHR